MSIHTVRINQQDEGMSSVAVAQSLEAKERQRAPTKKLARERLAAKLKIGVGTLENIIRDRVKRVDEKIRDRLQALLVRELEAEIVRLTHELEIARQCGAHLASQQVSEIETHLAAAKAILTGRAVQAE